MTNTSTNSHTALPLIGILGDGQLSMMMIDAYQKLGGKVFIFGSTDDSPASFFADKVFVGEVSDTAKLGEFFAAVDLVTLENEFNDGQQLSAVSAEFDTPVYPDPSRFALIEDKLSEKQFFQSLGIDLAAFFEVKSEQDLVDHVGYLKLAKGGYDGIGTYRVNNLKEAQDIFHKIKDSGVVLFEYAVEFKKELSLIGVTNGSDLEFYPMVETHQESGTCRYVTYPSGISESVQQEAVAQVTKILKELGTRGLFAFELFLTKDDKLILNESAPRPHNSGHITMDLMDCSQFENHMRAVTGGELITPKVLKESMTMVNLLGTRNADFDAEALLADVNDSETSTTLYRKKQSRVKRKMGHINLWGDDQMQRARDLVARLEV